MAQRLTSLQIDEVSLVDAPANQGARVMLFKRKGSPTMSDVPAEAEIEAYLKRDFSAERRREDADSGSALPDGSFPVENKADLRNAIHAYGRAKDKAKAKAHIIARARALGASDMIPDGWVKKGLIAKLREFIAKEAVSFDEAHDAVETGEYVSDMLEEFNEAMCALRDSVCSIMCDEAVTDKRAAVEQTFSQYREHIQGVVPEALEKALEGAISKRSSETMSEEERKAREKADRERDDMKKALDAATAELAILKMSPAHREYHAQLSGETQGQFAAMAVDKRDAHVAANPIRKSADSEAIEKANKIAADAMAEVAKLRDEQALADVVKRVTAIGGSADLAKALHAITKAAPDAAKQVEQALKGLAEQARTGKVFAEFGTSQGADTTSPESMMKAAVVEVRKADPKLKSDAAAISKIAGMPEHRELWNAYKTATTTRVAA